MMCSGAAQQVQPIWSVSADLLILDNTWPDLIAMDHDQVTDDDWCISSSLIHEMLIEVQITT